MGLEALRQYSKYASQLNPMIQKALDASVSAPGLVPPLYEKEITNTIIRLAPEFSFLTTKFDPQRIHNFNQITALPGVSGASGENGLMSIQNSTFTLQALQMKVLKKKGGVTNFLQDASQNYIDATAVEMENVLRAHMYELNFYNLYGNALSNTYEYSGLDTFVATNRLNSGFNAGAPQIPTTLDFMNNMIARANRYGGAKHKRYFAMSPEMVMKLSSLLTNVRLNQGMTRLGEIELDGGWKLQSYLGIPIVESTFVGGAGATTVGTVTATSGGTTTGSMSDGAKFFRVSAMTLNGESMASAEATVTLAGGGSTQWVNLAFTAIPGALSYKIYGSTSTGLANTKLIHQVPAFSYDGNGTQTALTGTINVPVLSISASTVIPAANVNDIPLTAVNGVNSEIIILHDCDPVQGLGKYPYTNAGGNRLNGVISFERLAKTEDFDPFYVKTYGALCPSFEATSVISRGWRVA